MTPNQAFSRLSKSGAFVEPINGCHIHWYWHQLPNGYRIMASRNLDGPNAPTFYNSFHDTVIPLQRVR